MSNDENKTQGPVCAFCYKWTPRLLMVLGIMSVISFNTANAQSYRKPSLSTITRHISNEWSSLDVQYESGQITAEECNRGRCEIIGGTIGFVTGGYYGMKYGAEFGGYTGGAVGGVVGGPGGAATGAVVGSYSGGIAGGVAGATYGEKYGKKGAGWVYDTYKWATGKKE